MLYNLVVKRSQIVEAQVKGTPATGTRYTFTEVPNLSRNNIVVYGIEAYSATQLATSPNGNTVVSTITGIVLTLKDDRNLEFVYQLPYYSLIRANNGGFFFPLKPRVINLTECYIQLTNTSGVSQNEVACLNLYYDIVSQ